jgi:hypothetical protein
MPMASSTMIFKLLPEVSASAPCRAVHKAQT